MRREALFINVGGRRLFTLYTRPAGNARAAVLVVPPFGDEMNKSRRMFTLLAARLAADGVATLCVDLHGTGDSSGEFVDARWETWCDDVRQAARWLRDSAEVSVTALGVRLGSALTIAALSDGPDQVRDFVFWQPVINGDLFLTQTLRTAVAADLLSAGGASTGTAALKRRLEAGETLKVAGYPITPAMARAIALQSLATCVPDRSRLTWFNIESSLAASPAPAAQRVIDAWRSKGNAVHHETLQGEPFWATQEIVVVPALIERTARCLAQEAFA